MNNKIDIYVSATNKQGKYFVKKVRLNKKECYRFLKDKKAFKYNFLFDVRNVVNIRQFLHRKTPKEQVNKLQTYLDSAATNLKVLIVRICGNEELKLKVNHASVSLIQIGDFNFYLNKEFFKLYRSKIIDKCVKDFRVPAFIRRARLVQQNEYLNIMHVEVYRGTQMRVETAHLVTSRDFKYFGYSTKHLNLAKQRVEEGILSG